MYTNIISNINFTYIILTQIHFIIVLKSITNLTYFYVYIPINIIKYLIILSNQIIHYIIPILYYTSIQPINL